MRRRFVLTALAALLTAACAVTIFFCCRRETPPAEPGEPAAYEDALRSLIDDYAADPADSETMRTHLQAIRRTDPAAAARWTEIMAYWAYANSEMPVHVGALPEDLPETDALCLVVLGYQLNPDGSIRDELRQRLETALSCAAQYPQAYILCTGGGTALQHPEQTEAGQMARWLIEHGIAAERIITEGQSLTTGQNALLSCGILARDYPQVTHLALISSDYHIPWGAVLFQAQCILQSSRMALVSNAACPVLPDNPPPLAAQAYGLRELAEVY